MSVEELRSTVISITETIAGKPLDEALDRELNEKFGPGTDTFETLTTLCREGMKDGWLGEREHGGIRFGRPIKPAPETHGFSVDVVEMTDVKGPHHSHPNGEIDFIVPMDEKAVFDGRSAGWLVYEPGTAHHPTVSGGRAIVLYLLPEGAIEFTR